MNKKQLELLIRNVKKSGSSTNIKIIGVDTKGGAGQSLTGAYLKDIFLDMGYITLEEQSTHPACQDSPIIYIYNGSLWFKKSCADGGGGAGSSAGATESTVPENNLTEDDIDNLSIANNIVSNKQDEIIDGGGTVYNVSSKAIYNLLKNSLYIDSNLILIPLGTKAGTGVGDGILYSVKGSDFTVVRNSTASRVDIDGYIKRVVEDEARINYKDNKPSILTEPQSTNKITYPFGIENTYWTKSGASVELDASTTGSDLLSQPFRNNHPSNPFEVFNSATVGGFYGERTGASTTYAGSELEIVIEAGKSYKLEFDATVSSGSNFNLRVRNGWDGSSSLALVVLNDSKTHYVMYFNSTISNTYMIEVKAYVTGTINLTNLSVKEVQGFASPFKDASDNVVNCARKITESSDVINTMHYVYHSNYNLVSGTTLSFSVIAKRGERKKIKITDNNYNVLPARCEFDLENGTVTPDSHYAPSDYSITELADGYYLCTVTQTASGDYAAFGFSVFTVDDNGNYSYIGDGTSGVYIAGTQLEEGYPTTFINNPEDVEGNEVTRVADVVGGATYSGDGESGCLIFKGAANANDLTHRRISISDGTNNNRIVFSFSNSSNKVQSYIVIDGSSVAYPSTTLTDITKTHTYVLRWAENDYSLWVDGVKKSSSTSGGAFTATLNTVKLADGSGTLNMFARIDYLIITDYLTDTEMANLK